MAYGKRVIYFWADGTWCQDAELEEHLQWKSDDFGTLKLDEDATDEMVDALIRSIVE